jgi:hypothetical protein
MTKKNFIALADHIKHANLYARYLAHSTSDAPFTAEVLDTLADFCQSQNSNFMRARWLGYIKGENGKNGGTR